MATINSSSRAKVAEVDFGFTQVEGLMTAEGDYYISATQANNILKFSTLPKNLARDVKRKLGEDFQSSKIASELHSNKVLVLSTDDFKKLTRLLDKEGNEVATALVDAFFDEAIERLDFSPR